MAHVAKYPASASGHMFNHYGRSEDMERSAYVIRGNEKINPERTHLNYNLAPDHGMSQLDFIHQRMSEIRCLKRADVNIMCDWVVTLPKVVPLEGRIQTIGKDDLSRLFFERTYRFMANRYGEQNVVSAYVHRDETTDHMHFAFVPVTKDKKRGGEKLSAKEVITRVDLQTFHTDLEQYLDGFGDWHFEIINDATKDGNRSIAELKRETAIKELQEQEQEAAAARQRAVAMQRAIEPMKRQKAALEGEIEALEQKSNDIVKNKPSLKMYQESIQLRRENDSLAEQVAELTRENNALRSKVASLESTIKRLLDFIQSKVPGFKNVLQQWQQRQQPAPAISPKKNKEQER